MGNRAEDIDYLPRGVGGQDALRGRCVGAGRGEGKPDRPGGLCSPPGDETFFFFFFAVCVCFVFVHLFLNSSPAAEDRIKDGAYVVGIFTPCVLKYIVGRPLRGTRCSTRY